MTFLVLESQVRSFCIRLHLWFPFAMWVQTCDCFIMPLSETRPVYLHTETYIVILNYIC